MHPIKLAGESYFAKDGRLGRVGRNEGGLRQYRARRIVRRFGPASWSAPWPCVVSIMLRGEGGGLRSPRCGGVAALVDYSAKVSIARVGSNAAGGEDPVNRFELIAADLALRTCVDVVLAWGETQVSGRRRTLSC